MKKELFCSSFLCFVLSCFSQTDSLRIKKVYLSDTNASFHTIPIFSMSGSDAESDLDEQDASSLLQSSRDLYTQFAAFQFGVARFRMRGYSSENQLVMINGVALNNPETSLSTWSNWGGLNDVTRFMETRFGNVANRYGFSGPGGYTSIDAKASSFKKGTRISYASANRVFRHRLMITHSTGLLKNNWAFSVSASSRQGNEVAVQGTYFNASSFYLSADKKINEKHLLSFVGYVSPLEKALSTSATLETFEITKDHFYNSAWGYQNGKVRNASVSKTCRPMLMLSHIYSPKEKSRLTTTVYYTFGKSGLSGINFNNAPNPKPDYYKYMPGYFFAMGDNSSAEATRYTWENEVNTRQINWDKLIAMNQANLYSIPAENGQVITTSETRARYILENKIEDLNQKGFNIVYNERKEHLFISAGLNGFIYKNRKYKEIEDLLGSSFWIDVDQFAQNLGVDPFIQQNDISRPDRKVYQGDRFSYDHRISINRIEVWAQAEYTAKKTDLYVGISLSDSKIWRTGYLANGKFPTNSKGESVKLNFLNYGFKFGSTFKLNGRNFITGNLTILSRAPEASNIFVSPKVRNDVVDDIKSEEVLSGDINYLAKYPNLKLRLTLYSTQINDQTWLRTYYDDSYNTLVNVIMTSVNQTHRGFECGLEKTIHTSHVLQLVAGFAQSYYSNQPKLQAWQDNNSASLYYNRRVYLKNYKSGNSPQFVSAIGYRYLGKKFWSAGLCINYFDKIYIEANPDRRTAEAIAKFQTNEKDQANEIIAQEELPAYYTVNANATKSFRLNKKYSLNFNLSINNLLNNTNILVGGFEQLRWDQQDVSKFPNKYNYMTGITYMFLINLNF
jgi:hypothetical protein